MNRLLFAGMLALHVGGMSASRAAAPPDAPVPPRTLTTRFTYKATVPKTPAQTQALDLWLPIPSDNEFQTVSDLKVESPLPHQVNRETDFGNRMIYIRSEKPSDPLTVTVSFVVKRKPVQVLAGTPAMRTGDEENARELRKLMQPDSKVPTGGRYGKIAADVSTGRTSVQDKARSFFTHVVETMEYDYKKESPKLGEGDAAFVCDYKKGNCSDLHSYLISLARSSKIPAFLEYGFPLTGIPSSDPVPREGSIAGYHCWTWFHDTKRGWVPLDASDARRWSDAKQADVKAYLFGNLITERSAVAMSRGRDLTLVPRQQYGPVNYFIYPYAEADGKPVDAQWDLKYTLLNVE